jgi:hypothetical protein
MFNLRCIYFRIEINGAPKESYVLRADQAWPAVTLPISSGVKPWSSIPPAAAWKNPPVRPGQALFVPWPTRGDSRSVSVPMPAWSMPTARTEQLEKIGERSDSRFEPAGIAAILRSHGFCAIEDVSFQEIASRFGHAVQGLAPGHAGVHVVHAKH